ncbi:hypothetical protein RvY_10752-3 [Ramazzottius varieornatus]|uniref:guanylate cyclase n=1 Tax=Ramazzottius varieornatus TaxID=947166 RepID=A0A1D1VDU1_RAMVA|nr:hypothetical protein RvY_10752-3 [Ramazzottius varieornatus]
MKICLLVFLLGKNAPQLNSLFETAVRRVAVDQVSFTNIIRNVEVSDEQDMQAFILEKTFYFLDRICPLLIPSPVAPVRVIMTAGSSETEASLLVDIGREENVVVMSLTRRSPSLLDRGRSPTLVQLPTFRIGNSSSISQTQVGEAFFGSMQLLAQLSTRADRCSRSGQGGQTAANLVQCLRNMLEKSSHFYNFTLPSDPLTLERLLVGSWSSPQQNLSEEHSEQSTTASYGPQNSDDTSSVNAVAAVFGVILGMIIVISFARMWQKLHRFANLAWVIDERKMEYVRTWIPTIGRWAVPIEKGSMQGVVMVYDGRITTTSVSFPFYVDFHTVKKHQLAKLVLKLMRDIDHPNVCKFYGIMWTTNHHIYGKSMVYVAEHTTKGFLRHVIDDDSLALNWDLRFCLMWDLFLGLKYVHRSKLRCHGCLTSICAYVDERFTLKLAGTGILPYMAVLVRSHPEQLKPRDDYFGPVMNMQRLWMAPEVVADIRQSFTKAADTYSFGVILYEMSTRNAPFNVALCDEVEFEGFNFVEF